MIRPHADTVIVGAGSSGAVIAARLTESAAHDVLLLEAGPDYPHPDALPEDLRDGRKNSMVAHDWHLRHRPAAGTPILFDFPRGKVVGGSSAVNTCIALRGQPYDYDEWASMGLREWSFEQCLPAFKRLEDDRDFRDSLWHGGKGPIPVRRHSADELVPWQAAFVDACESLGFARCTDTNDPHTTGVGPHAMNKIDGVRMSAARGYLTPAVRARGNLRIRARTVVRRVLIDSGRRVRGVEVDTDGVVYTIAARRVVLSAGAIASPAILMRSGIGPREQLERLGVDVVRHLPAVGARLLDHPGVAIFFRPRRGVLDRSRGLIQTVLRFGAAESELANDMLVQPGSFVPLPRITLPLVSLMAQVGKPRGHGRLEIVSTNVRRAPRIHSDFFADPHDLSRALDAMLLAVRLSETPVMRELATPFWPSVRTRKDPDALRAWMRRVCGSGYHPCGTVPMGRDGDAAAAADGRGRVVGVEGLYVADASIMPTIPSANTNLTTLMIGERFGEWLQTAD